jgi:uncharacterized OB-fold protein
MLLPEIDRTNEAFWTGGREGRLLIGRCASCATWVHPPAPYCSACGGRDVRPVPVSGRGEVYCYTVNHMAWIAGEDAWQRVLALVELDEQRGLRVLSNIVECDESDLRCGLPVEVIFHAVDDVHLPVFRPRPDAPGGRA